jgi:hypothetical protein
VADGSTVGSIAGSSGSMEKVGVKAGAWVGTPATALGSKMGNVAVGGEIACDTGMPSRYIQIPTPAATMQVSITNPATNKMIQVKREFLGVW